MQRTIVGLAAGEYIDWCNSQQQKKLTIVCTYLQVWYENNAMPNIMPLQIARSQTGHQLRDSI